MKKFLVYLCVILITVSTGFAIFFLVRDNEVISLSTTSLYKDVNSTFELALDITDPNSYTEITLSSSNEEVLEITSKEIDLKNDVAKGSFTAKTGGVSRVNFQTNNSKFRNLYCDVVIGDGSINYPFYISTEEQLNRIGKTLYDEEGQLLVNPYTLSSSYELVANLDMSKLDETWTPIGFESNTPFTGNFNGNGYSINNLNIVGNGKNIGLFQEIAEGASVTNLKFTNATLNTSSFTEYAGVVAGVNSGNVEGIEIASVQVYNNNSTAIIGGVVGQNKSIVTPTKKAIARVDKCSVNIALNGVAASYDQDGNLIADATPVKGLIGGLVGHNFGGVVINSYTKGDYKVNLDTTFAGLVYKNEYVEMSTGTGPYTNDEGAHVKDCYSIINIDDNGVTLSQVAALIYENIYDELAPGESINQVLGNYYDITRVPSGVTGLYPVADTQYVAQGIQTTELKKVDLPSHITFTYRLEGSNVIKEETGVAYWNTQVWLIDGTNEGYPVLKYDATNIPDGFLNFTKPDEEVTQPDDDTDLNSQLLAGLENTHVIDRDVDLSGVEWIPVGTADQPFNGTLIVKNGAVIRGLKVTANAYDYAGFFGVLGEKAQVMNLVLENPTIINTNHAYVGAIAGANGINGKVRGGSIINSQVIDGTLNGTVAVGGIAGHNNGILQNVTVTNSDQNEIVAMVSPLKLGYVGGFAGQNYGTIDSTSYNLVSGNVRITADGDNKTVYAGGVAGQNNGTIKNVSVYINTDQNDKVYGITLDSNITAYAGGVAGYGNGVVDTAFVSARIVTSTANDSYVAGGVGYIDKIKNSRNINVKNVYVYSSYIKGSNAGGLVGYLAGDDSISVLYTEKNFFSQLYGEKIVINEEYYKQSDLVANISSSAVEESVSLYGNYTGGLVCEIQRGFVTDSYSKALLCGKNNAGFAYDIMYNNADNTGGVITRCYVIANFSGGENNYYVSSSVVHSSNNINKRSAGFIDDYFYSSNKGEGKEPAYFTGVTHDVVNWFKDDENKDVTRRRDLDTLRKDIWSSFEVKNTTTGLSPWVIDTGKVPQLDINIKFDVYQQSLTV